VLTNWLQGFLERYQEAAQQVIGRPQMLGRVEEKVAKWHALKRIDRETLLAIEESDAWDYREWWPRGSMEFDGAVAIRLLYRLPRAATFSLHNYMILYTISRSSPSS